MQGAGSPGSSVQWGPWGGAGMAVQVAGFMQRMARLGLGVLPPPIGLDALSHALRTAWAPRLQQGSPVTVGENQACMCSRPHTVNHRPHSPHVKACASTSWYRILYDMKVVLSLQPIFSFGIGYSLRLVSRQLSWRTSCEPRHLGLQWRHSVQPREGPKTGWARAPRLLASIRQSTVLFP